MKVFFIACALIVCAVAVPAGRKKDKDEFAWPFFSIFDSDEETDDFPFSFSMPRFSFPTIPSFFNFGPPSDGQVVNSTSKTEISNGHKIVTNSTLYKDKTGGFVSLYSIVLTSGGSEEPSSETATLQPAPKKDSGDNEVVEPVGESGSPDDLQA